MKNKTIKVVSLLFMFFSCLTGCNNSGTLPEGKVRVSFDTCTNLETNIIEDQIIDKGSKVNRPEVIFPTDITKNQKVFAWYTEKSYQNEWDFSDVVEKSMTLYAKWAETCTVKYYLKGQTTPVWTISNIIKGKPLELHDELCDGYKFNGYFSDSNCTVPFDLTKEINEDTTVYIDRSETIHINAGAIKRRFRMVAAGGTGSSAGYIGDVVSTGEEEYIDVNFGYSKSKDPYMNITNPQLNISKSQKLKVVFKNLGGAENIKFYWVAKLADGTFVNSRQSFSEDNAWNYNFTGDERYMDDEDDWLVKEFNLSEQIINGVSSWANCVTLVSLRIQAGYLSKSVTDLTNVFRFKSISGIADETYKGYKNSKEVENFLVDSSKEKLEEAAALQVQPENGYIFPKNNEVDGLISFGSDQEYFKNEEGLVLYSKYDKTASNKFTFNIKNAHISVETNSLVKFKLRNLSYIGTMNVVITTLKPGSSVRTVSSSKTLTISNKDEAFKEYELNFYDVKTIVGDIQEISFMFTNIGVDNAMILKSFWFETNKAFQNPGLDFDSKNFGGLTATEDVGLTIQTDTPTTKFDIKNDNAAIAKVFSSNEAIDLKAYSKLVFKTYKPVGELSSITIKITVNSNEITYIVNEFDDGLNTIELPYEETLNGTLKKIEFVFDKTGYVKISSLIFEVDKANAIDFNNMGDLSFMLSDWAAHLSFDNSKNAALYNAQVGSDHSNSFRYYFGFLLKEKKRETGNICLDGKTKMHLIYQNMSNNDKFQTRLYGINKLENPSDYLTAFSESNVIGNCTYTLRTNMSEFEWAVSTIDLTQSMSKYLVENWYLSNLNCRIDGGDSSMNFYIRAIVIE